MALVASALQVVIAPIGLASEFFDPDSSVAMARQDTRVRGVTTLDLPFDFRAQLDATYTSNIYASDALTRTRMTEFGPGLRGNHSLQSHVSLTRFISDRIEIGIVWGGRSRITDIDLLNLQRQTVGALIRFVP